MRRIFRVFRLLDGEKKKKTEERTHSIDPTSRNEGSDENHDDEQHRSPRMRFIDSPIYHLRYMPIRTGSVPENALKSPHALLLLLRSDRIFERTLKTQKGNKSAFREIHSSQKSYKILIEFAHRSGEFSSGSV